MFDKDEMRKLWAEATDNEIIKAWLEEEGGYRPEAREVMREEIEKRSLWAKVESELQKRAQPTRRRTKARTKAQKTEETIRKETIMSTKPVCPLCGSEAIRRVKSSQLVSVSGDRACKSCGAVWAPPVSRLIAWIMTLIPGILAFGLLMFIIDDYYGMYPPHVSRLSYLGRLAAIGTSTFFARVTYGGIKILVGKAGKLKIIKKP